MFQKVFFVLSLLAASGGILFFFTTNKQNSDMTIASPLPVGITKIFPHVAPSAFHWEANVRTAYDTGQKKPEITASSGISYDITSEKLLFKKDIEARLPIASLTKIMTAVVALENMPLEKQIKIKKSDSEIGEDVMGLSAGEKLTLEELLYGLILHSGNDAAEVIASGSPFGRENFIYLMNKKAEDLGLSYTHFTNPTGLEGDGKQYSTAYDLLVIARYALRNSEFVKIVGTYDYDIPYTRDHKEFALYNETNLLTSYPGVKGIKTGFTDEAGMCLVTYLEYGGHKIIAVLLNSENRRQEMKDLLDYSLKTLGVKPPAHS